MNQPTPASLEVALALHRAWTGGDVDGVMDHLAGRDAYRGHLRGFRQMMIGLMRHARQ